MTAASRLGKLTQTLTAREYAVLRYSLRARDLDADTDWREAYLLPLSERDEYYRIIERLNDFGLRLGILLQAWDITVFDLDRRIAWVESLNAWKRQWTALAKEMKQAGVKPPRLDLGQLDHGGRLLGDEDEEPATWPIEELPEVLLADIAQEAVDCFASLEAIRIVVDELSQEELEGAPFLSAISRRATARFERVLHATVPRLRALGFTVEPQPATPERIAKMRRNVGRGAPNASAYELTPERRAELAALEECIANARRGVS